jgi:hypothetical protein
MKILVEYSKEQNAFHRSTTQERIKNEFRCKQRGIKSTYIVLVECDSYDEADDFISENYDLIKNCSMYKDKEGNLHAI